MERFGVLVHAHALGGGDLRDSGASRSLHLIEKRVDTFGGQLETMKSSVDALRELCTEQFVAVSFML